MWNKLFSRACFSLSCLLLSLLKDQKLLIGNKYKICDKVPGSDYQKNIRQARLFWCIAAID